MISIKLFGFLENNCVARQDLLLLLFAVDWFKVTCNYFNIMPPVSGSGVYFQSSNIIFFITGFFSPWKTPKPVSWNYPAFFFIANYYYNFVKYQLNSVTSNSLSPLRFCDVERKNPLCKNNLSYFPIRTTLFFNILTSWTLTLFSTVCWKYSKNLGFFPPVRSTTVFITVNFFKWYKL